jgi:ABC-type anion transport system duplicated permease subunit
VVVTVFRSRWNPNVDYQAVTQVNERMVELASSSRVSFPTRISRQYAPVASPDWHASLLVILDWPRTSTSAISSH